MRGIPRIATDIGPPVESEMARAMGPFLMNIGNHDMIVKDSNHLLTGNVTLGSNTIIVLSLARNPERLPHGMGLMHQLTADEARQIARDLVREADAIEAAAAKAAAAVIAKAAGQ